jgi:hypothetical protein
MLVMIFMISNRIWFSRKRSFSESTLIYLYSRDGEYLQSQLRHELREAIEETEYAGIRSFEGLHQHQEVGVVVSLHPLKVKLDCFGGILTRLNSHECHQLRVLRTHEMTNEVACNLIG